MSSTSWREQWQQWQTQSREALATIPAAFEMVRTADPKGWWILSISTAINACLPASQAYAAGRIIDSVTHGAQFGDAWQGLMQSLPWILLEFGLLTVSFIVTQARSFADHTMNARLTHYIAMRIMHKANELDVQYFEDAAFYDKLQNAKRQAEFRAISLVTGVFAIIQQCITLVSFLIIVVAFQPWIAVILFGASIPAFIAQGRYSRLFFRMLTWRAPEFRQLRYLEELMTSDKTIKEVRLFGLADSIISRHEDTFRTYYDEDVTIAKKRSLMSVWWGFVSTASFYVAYTWVIWLAIQGRITVGNLTFYIAILRQSQGTFQGLFNSVNWLFENGLFMTQLIEFFALSPVMQRSQNAVPMPIPLREGIRFENVSFKYPEHDHWTLRNVSFQIHPGETLALVGLNGAGKTTLVKLLTRLYDATEGRITIDGVDIRDIDPDDLQRHIGVIFQDFVRYQMSLNDNIGFGDIDHIHDEARIQRAAQHGGADEIAAQLAQGYNTTLGRQFQQGRELSGGQWQKIALSRAFMREGGILILDEPTAALDAQYEFEVFQRFRELTQGRTAVLISHRFSTVRMADRIAVLVGGELHEIGTHAELMQHNGMYAELFEMQASGYR